MAAPEGYKALGKIGISYKGEYASNTVYERLDAVAHNGSTYLAIKDAPDVAPRDDKVNWIYLAKGFSGDIGDSEITFTEADARENIDTGESVKTVFGKIKKWFNDMTVTAFSQVITSNEDLMALTKSGYLVDALAVKNQFAEVNGKLNNFCQFYNSTGTLGVALKEYSVNFVLKSPFILIVGASTGAYLVFGYCGTSGYYAGIATEITGSNKLFTFYANDRGNAPSFSEK